MKKVGIFGSEYQADKQLVIKRLFEKLASLEAEVFVDRDFYLFLTDALNYEPPVSGILTSDEFDLDVALSLGGDGTFLRTAARVNKQDIPILGINTGRLGFLADVASNDIEDTLDELFKNYYKTEERTLLRLHTEDRVFHGYNYALNEIAILKRDTSSMVTIHTALNGEYLTSYQADGNIMPCILNKLVKSILFPLPAAVLYVMDNRRFMHYSYCNSGIWELSIGMSGAVAKYA